MSNQPGKPKVDDADLPPAPYIGPVVTTRDGVVEMTPEHFKSAILRWWRKGARDALEMQSRKDADKQAAVRQAKRRLAFEAPLREGNYEYWKPEWGEKWITRHWDGVNWRTLPFGQIVEKGAFDEWRDLPTGADE